MPSSTSLVAAVAVPFAIKGVAYGLFLVGVCVALLPLARIVPHLPDPRDLTDVTDVTDVEPSGRGPGVSILVLAGFITEHIQHLSRINQIVLDNIVNFDMETLEAIRFNYLGIITLNEMLYEKFMTIDGADDSQTVENLRQLGNGVVQVFRIIERRLGISTSASELPLQFFED